MTLVTERDKEKSDLA
uniref:Uncharacterized protein n=1 Tax=Moniliophthora roreri TaxID=221103 RepID=A0A0W0G0H8_MONRR